MTHVKLHPGTQNRVMNRGNDPFNHFMNDFFRVDNQHSNSIPSVNLIESGNDFFIEMAAPGYNKADFNIKMENNLLTISTEKEDKEENDLNFLRSEFRYGSFSRSFKIGKNLDTDKIKATYENGILRIGMEKREEAKEKPARNIQIN
ncbi:MAG: Hsp20/alpha crystallin family protein [Bacteroidales bacterium]|nr:Hsp20/alpha crystallin family protein [Bacteroidales bacterium]MCF8456209.1 Hsp20/alpha crystallin family protein [Bacteroidales bacterium]